MHFPAQPEAQFQTKSLQILRELSVNVSEPGQTHEEGCENEKSRKIKTRFSGFHTDSNLNPICLSRLNAGKRLLRVSRSRSVR